MTSPIIKMSPGKRNKRKSLEPKKVMEPLRLFNDPSSDGEDRATSSPDSRNSSSTNTTTSLTPSPSALSQPPKKRFRHDFDEGKPISPPSTPSPSPSPNKVGSKIHRPWDSHQTEQEHAKKVAESFAYPHVAAAAQLAFQQEQAKAFVTLAAQEMGMTSGLLALYKLYPQLFDPSMFLSQQAVAPVRAPQHTPEPEQEEPLALVKKPESESSESQERPEKVPVEPKKPQTPKGSSQKAVGQRNYKNMTRERRVEANARERQRVHTITAAFDTLQCLIPSPEHVIKPPSPEKIKGLTQVKDIIFESGSGDDTGSEKGNQYRLSKLSIIKIATAYIMLLSRMAGYDYTEDKSAPSVEECIGNCAQLLNQENKIKAKI